MVKNTTGGNKAKSKASKNFARPANTNLRTADDECELYAQVTAILGNGMCHVLCAQDGIVRLCHIRGKFRGRRKSDNIVKRGTWLLVGLREWESSATSKKMQNCDLLEVYADHEKDKLKTDTTVNWSLFTTNDNKEINIENDDNIVFTDEKTDEYREIVENKMTDSQIKIDVGDDDVINVDDI